MSVLWSVCEILQLQRAVRMGRQGEGGPGPLGGVGSIPFEDARGARIRMGARPTQGVWERGQHVSQGPFPPYGSEGRCSHSQGCPRGPRARRTHPGHGGSWPLPPSLGCGPPGQVLLCLVLGSEASLATSALASGILCSSGDWPGHLWDLVASHLEPLRHTAPAQLGLEPDLQAELLWSVVPASMSPSHGVPCKDARIILPLPSLLLSRPATRAGQWCSQTPCLAFRPTPPSAG